MSCFERIDTILNWIDEPNQARFVAVYLSELDNVGHWYGPNSKEMDEALTNVDQAIGRLLQGIKLRGLLESSSIMILGDHGSTGQKKEDMIHLESLLSTGISNVEKWFDGPVAFIMPSAEAISDIYHELQTALRKIGNPCIAYLRTMIPRRYRFRSSPRIPPIVIECKLGWAIGSRNETWIPKGQHGYDPAEDDMLSVVIASGRRFQKNNVALDLQNNLDVYNVVAKLLNIAPQPNNGTDRLSSLILS